jgi:hypothetical protein
MAMLNAAFINAYVCLASCFFFGALLKRTDFAGMAWYDGRNPSSAAGAIYYDHFAGSCPCRFY